MKRSKTILCKGIQCYFSKYRANHYSIKTSVKSNTAPLPRRGEGRGAGIVRVWDVTGKREGVKKNVMIQILKIASILLLPSLVLCNRPLTLTLHLFSPFVSRSHLLHC